MKNKTFKFHIDGMHCASCVVLTESELGEILEVSSVKASLDKKTVEVTGDFGEKKEEQIVEELNKVLVGHGYTLSLEKVEKKINWQDFKIALPIALLFMALFVVLQKLGLVNLIGGENVTYGTAFVIGLVASVSSCMAVVGGLVLSVSANFAKEGDKVMPQLYFHAGRIISFFVLGGVIGFIGASFQLGTMGIFILSLIVAIVLLILGINLLDIFHFTKKLQITMPSFLSKHILGIKKINHSLVPLLIGVVTFFLPCGFTQSMQIYSLSTGSFWTGAFTMLSFALGTLPVLLILSFSSIGIHDKVKSGIFFKTAGIVVIFFALFNLINSLVAVGLLNPIFNF